MKKREEVEVEVEKENKKNQKSEEKKKKTSRRPPPPAHDSLEIDFRSKRVKQSAFLRNVLSRRVGKQPGAKNSERKAFFLFSHVRLLFSRLSSLLSFSQLKLAG